MIDMKPYHRILHLRASNFAGGPEKQIFEHLKRLNKSEFWGGIASFKEHKGTNPLSEKAQKEGMPYLEIPMASSLDFRAQPILTRIVRDHRIDLLCVHGYKACLMGFWAGKRTKKPVLAFSRGDTNENRKVAFYEWLERKTLPAMAGIVTVSEEQKRKLASSGIRNKKIWVVHNAVEHSLNRNGFSAQREREFFQELNIPRGSKLVVTAGRFSPEKGHRYLIEAIAKLPQKKDIFFVFCGDGVCRGDLERQAKKVGVMEQLRFPGFRQDLQEFFSIMDLLVLPSLTEGLPNVVLEAFACAKPVVATRVGGVPEIVEDGVNGFLVPPANPRLLAEAIINCLSSKGLGRSFGEAGYQKVKSGFTFESQTQKLERIYKEILTAGGCEVE